MVLFDQVEEHKQKKKKETMPLRQENRKTEERNRRHRLTRFSIVTSRVLSVIFTPFYLPLVSTTLLFFFSYLALLHWQYKVFIFGMVYLFTIFLPTMLIHLYMRYQGWSVLKLISREGRMVPYVISISSYFFCFYLMKSFHFPHFLSIIILAALFIQIVCAITNIWFKISTHTAAMGGITGGLLAYAEIFAFNPLWWLCLCLIVGGLVGTGRMMLRQHSLHQVVYGFLVGVVVSFFVIIML